MYPLDHIKIKKNAQLKFEKVIIFISEETQSHFSIGANLKKTTQGENRVGR
jgi:hypothetical protein